jgi:type V secretory pathway adhesin AidA
MQSQTFYQNSDFTIFGVGGMIMLNCSYGVISGNQVHWTWADAIHNTGQSNNLLIVNNTIHNPGDDSIAVVSYGGNSICHDITIINNRIYNTTNRGITVIGGLRVKIADNILSDMWNLVGGREVVLTPFSTN